MGTNAHAPQCWVLVKSKFPSVWVRVNVRSSVLGSSKINISSVVQGMDEAGVWVF